MPDLYSLLFSKIKLAQDYSPLPTYWNVNTFVPNAPFLYPLKTSENFTVFCCFQGVEKRCIENKWVNINISKHASNPKYLTKKRILDFFNFDFISFYFISFFMPIISDILKKKFQKTGKPWHKWQRCF